MEKAHWYVVGMVVLGSLANALSQLSEARKKNLAYGLLDICISFVISAFAGVMCWLIAHYYTDDLKLLSTAAGFGAFMGLEGLNRARILALEIAASRAKKELNKRD